MNPHQQLKFKYSNVKYQPFVISLGFQHSTTQENFESIYSGTNFEQFPSKNMKT